MHVEVNLHHDNSCHMWNARGVCTNQKNTIYAEIFGNGRAYSVNYDRIITISEKTKFAPRIGSYMGGIRFTVPLEANLLFSKSATSKHFVEFGVGTTFRSPKDYEPGLRFFDDVNAKDYEEGIWNEYTARIGYRHQKPKGGWMYRAGILSIYMPYRTKNKIFFPMPAVSVGYTF